MNIRICIMAMLLLLLNLKLPAQTPPPHALGIGSAMPEVRLALLNYNRHTESLSAFKNKLIILDFWESFCTSCLHKFPFLDSMQNELKDSMQIILVNSLATGDDAQKITRLFANLKKINKGLFVLPTVVDDTVLDKLFPHTSLPHYVWLYDNKVIAITASAQVTAANMHLALKNELPALILKNDAADTLSPMFVQERNPAILYGSAFKPYDSLKLRRQGMMKMEGHKLFYFVNTPVLSLYESALQQSFESGFILNVADSSAYLPGNEEWEQWQEKHSFCYQLTVPESATAATITAMMLEDLNRYLGLNGHYEESKTPGREKRVFVLSGQPGQQP